jgi:hypothetical protein
VADAQTQESARASGLDAPPAETKGGDAGVVTPLDFEEVIRSQIHPGVKRCYQRGLESDPQSGRLVLMLQIRPDGLVDWVTVNTNTGLTIPVTDCIVEVARHAKFPPGGNGRRIQIPMRLELQGYDGGAPPPPPAPSP